MDYFRLRNCFEITNAFIIILACSCKHDHSEDYYSHFLIKATHIDFIIRSNTRKSLIPIPIEIFIMVPASAWVISIMTICRTYIFAATRLATNSILTKVV